MTQLADAQTPRSPLPEARGRQWLTNVPRGQFWWFFVAAIFFNFGFAAYYFLFNVYLMSFGFTERFLGVVGGLVAVGTILGTIPIGVIAQRYGLRATLTGGIVLSVACSVLRALIVWEPAQLVLAVCCGLTMCFWAVCLSPSIAGLTKEHERPVAFGLSFASGIGIAGLGAFAGGRLPGWLRNLSPDHLLTPTNSMDAALVLACGIALLALIPVSRISLRPPASDTQLPRFSNPFLRRFLPAMAIWGLVTGSFVPFANVYFVHHLGFSLERTGSVLSFSNLAQFVAMLGAPLLFRKAGFPVGIMLTQLATAVALISLATSHSGMQAAVIYWGYAAVQCMNEPGIYNLLMNSIPVAEHNGASAATFFVSGIVQAIASLAMGPAIVRFGYPAALTAIAALAVVAAISFGRLPRGLPSVTERAI